MKNKLEEYIREVFSLDLRSLALFRILIGTVLFWNLFIRSQNISDFYTNEGILPATAALKQAGFLSFSLHAISGSVEIQILLFFISFIFAIFLILGYKTKISITVSWFLFMSLCNRNVLINSGADHMLRLFLFWGMFLPLNIVWSVDSLSQRSKVSAITTCSIATIAFILQLHFTYLFTAAWKFGNMWVFDGTAVNYVLHNYMFVTNFGLLLNRYFSWKLSFLTRAVFFIEALGFFFFYSPIKNGLVKTIIVFVFIFMHIGFGLGLSLGTFPYIAITIWTALLPAYFWNHLSFIIKIPKNSNLLTAKKNNQKLFILNYKTFLISGCLIYVFLYNIYGLTSRYFPWPKSLMHIGYPLGLQQSWYMFTQTYLEKNTWYVIPGELKNRKSVDLYYFGQTVSFDSPLIQHKYFPNVYLAKYFINFSPSNYKYFSVFMCKKWNTSHKDKERIEKIKIYSLTQKISLTEKEYPITRSLVYQWSCEKSNKISYHL